MSYEDAGFNNLLTIEKKNEGINDGNKNLVGDGSLGFGKLAIRNLNPTQDIQTSNFVSGTSGWQIKGDGDASFNNLTLTGGVIKYGKTSFTDTTNAGYILNSSGFFIGNAGDTKSLKFTQSSGALEIKGGTITGSIIQTGTETYPNVLINNNGITVHGESIYFKKTDGTSYGTIDPSVTGLNIRSSSGIPLILQTQGNAAITISAGSGNINISSDLYSDKIYVDGLYAKTTLNGYIKSYQDLIPNSTYNLGNTSNRWKTLYATSINTSGVSTFGNNIISSSTSYTVGLTGTRWGNIYSINGNFSGDVVASKVVVDTLDDNGSGISLSSHIYPSSNYDLGSSSYRFDEIYAASINITGTINCATLLLSSAASSPSSAGEIKNYASGATDQFRGVPGDGTWVGSFDMTAI